MEHSAASKQQSNALNVSIVIPAYNAALWLEDSLDSVQYASDECIEVVVVDDGSTDATAEIAKRHPVVSQLISQQNAGVSAARRAGLAATTGQAIVFLDADDLLLKNAIDSQWHALCSSKADAVYSFWQPMQASGNQWLIDEPVTRHIESVSPDHELAFFTSMWCPTAAYMWSRSFLAKHPGWHSNLPVIQDARFAFDAARAGCRFSVNEVSTVLYRKHEKGSVSSNDQGKFLADCLLNAQEIEACWRNDQALNQPRIESLLDCYEFIAFAARSNANQLGKTAFDAAMQLSPEWRPRSTAKRRIIGRVLGNRLLRLLI